ncbi:MAG TPA: hypothetical protein VN039_03860 [Nitrospira sp.]|nr:hypothetical protein [Nitrospira sp.]
MEKTFDNVIEIKLEIPDNDSYDRHVAVIERFGTYEGRHVDAIEVGIVSDRMPYITLYHSKMRQTTVFMDVHIISFRTSEHG